MNRFISSSLTAVDLPAELFDAISSVFVSLGVGKISDVHYIGEADLTGAVKLVHPRKLIACWGTSRCVVYYLRRLFEHNVTIKYSLQVAIFCSSAISIYTY